MRFIYIVLLAAVAFSCGKKGKEVVTEQPVPPTVATDTTSTGVNYRYVIIPAPENTFGYDVFKDEKLFIHQPHIPGMSGVKGFSKEPQAKKAAELMIQKMSKGIIPPTLTEAEIIEIMKE